MTKEWDITDLDFDLVEQVLQAYKSYCSKTKEERKQKKKGPSRNKEGTRLSKTGRQGKVIRSKEGR